ncbi:unnamed protein product, partial [Mesorhabditis spiculigera]
MTYLEMTATTRPAEHRCKLSTREVNFKPWKYTAQLVLTVWPVFLGFGIVLNLLALIGVLKEPALGGRHENVVLSEIIFNVIRGIFGFAVALTGAHGIFSKSLRSLEYCYFGTFYLLVFTCIGQLAFVCLLAQYYFLAMIALFALWLSFVMWVLKKNIMALEICQECY